MLATKPMTPSRNAKAQPATITSYTANEVKITTKTALPGLLFLSDNYYPGWKATIDEKSVQIIKANYSFRAIEIPSGIHTVTFSYKPFSFYIGSVISLVSFLILIYFFLLDRFTFFRVKKRK